MTCHVCKDHKQAERANAQLPRGEKWCYVRQNQPQYVEHDRARRYNSSELVKIERPHLYYDLTRFCCASRTRATRRSPCRFRAGGGAVVKSLAQIHIRANAEIKLSQLLRRRQTSGFPGFEAAGHGTDVFVAHLLQTFGGERGTPAAAAMTDDRHIASGKFFFDVEL